MGRANSRPRKGKASGGGQHLPKVGSAEELADEGRAERAAVMDVMGLGNLSQGTKSALFWIGTVIMIAAIVALVIFTAF